MFRCPLCQCLIAPGISSQRVVLQHRAKTYRPRAKANVVVRRKISDKKLKKQFRDDPGGSGQEIVREVIACAPCAARRGP